MPRWVVATLLALALLLAGCSDDDAGDDADDGTDGGNTLDDDSTTAPGRGGNATAPVSAEPVVGSCDLTVISAFVVNEQGVCAFSEAAANLTAFRSAIVELTWDSLQPGALDVGLSAESDDCNRANTNDCVIEETAGTTAPLNVTLDAQQIAEHADANLRGVVIAPGVVAEQAFTMHISLFELEDVPAGYSAI